MSALDVLIDQLAEGHLYLPSALRFDLTRFGGHEPRQLAGRQPLATHHNSADVLLLAGDRGHCPGTHEVPIGWAIVRASSLCLTKSVDR